MESRKKIVNMPLRSGGKKMRKRRELDALLAQSMVKRNSINKTDLGAQSQDKLLSMSTDEAEDSHWVKVPPNSHYLRNRKLVLLRFCIPFLISCGLVTVTGFVYWLYFDLRQQLYEYHLKIEEVAISSQNLPETLQKWHETSVSLTKNQTAIQAKISDLKNSIDMVENNLTAYKATLEVQKSFLKSQQLIADFGAKVEAVKVDIDNINDHVNTLLKSQSNLETSLKALQTQFAEMKNYSTNTQQIPSNLTEQINESSTIVLHKVDDLQKQLNAINNTFSQQTMNIHEEIAENKGKIYELFDRTANLTSHVTSMEATWPAFRQKVSSLESYTNTLIGNISMVNTDLQNNENMVKNLTKLYTSLLNDSIAVWKYISANAKNGNKTVNSAGVADEKQNEIKLKSQDQVNDRVQA